jgi:PAS domain S-box-containing protein/putative nucleotidyltransferase with HDIG domain
MVAFALAGALLTMGLSFAALLVGHRRLKVETARYRRSSRDLLATVDARGCFRRVNPAWTRALGHSVEALRARELVEFVHRDERADVLAQLQARESTPGRLVESCNRFQDADGKYRWLEWDLSGSTSGGAAHMVARDITEQHTAQLQLANSAKSLELKILERTHELDEARAETLQLLAAAVEYRDDSTFEHTERVGLIASEVAARLGMRSEQVKRLREAAPLHDIGKIAIPDAILLKPGRLNAHQQQVMQTHAALGARLLSRSSSPVLQMAAVIAATHHEWWNGSGYPKGLAGERIPLVGRVVAVADVFDALTHERPYMPAWSVKQAIARIERSSGTQFDPRVVEAFLAVYEEAQLTSVEGSEPDSRQTFSSAATADDSPVAAEAVPPEAAPAETAPSPALVPAVTRLRGGESSALR